MRLALVCLALACASPKSNSAADAAAGQRPAEQTAAPATSETQAITAAEAAAAYARDHGHTGSPGDAAPAADELACRTDADCALTTVEEGRCCPTSCTPRPVTKTRAQALREGAASCNGGKGCPQLSCMPPRSELRAACVHERCALAVVSAPQ